MTKPKSLLYLFSAVLAIPPLTLTSVSAQQSEATVIEEIVIIGSRRQDGRSQTESLVPVDVFGGEDLSNMGSTDMDQALSNLIPSYKVDQQAINDAATLVRPATLRGLPPDSTLVLVNGKRRHRASVITFLGNGVADGSQGPDVSTIPSVALKRVEVLRDGAAAQYGSDAIAGVINFELKDDAEGGTVEARWGQHYEGDGDGFNFAGNIGLPMSSSGFLNLSMEYKEADPTSRAFQRPDAQALADAGNPHIDDPGYEHLFHPTVMVWGSPETKYDYKFFGNMGIDLSDSFEAYGYGNYAKRKVEGGFYFRNPHTRGGVFDGPVHHYSNGQAGAAIDAKKELEMLGMGQRPNESKGDFDDRMDDYIKADWLTAPASTRSGWRTSMATTWAAVARPSASSIMWQAPKTSPRWRPTPTANPSSPAFPAVLCPASAAPWKTTARPSGCVATCPGTGTWT